MVKMRGIGIDGASTMVGCQWSYCTLKSITPSATGVHCAAHRLNLASSHAGDAVPYAKKFDNSAVRTAGLEAVHH